MIENHRSGLPWQLMRGCRYISDGLRGAGFDGGWLSGRAAVVGSTELLVVNSRWHRGGRNAADADDCAGGS